MRGEQVKQADLGSTHSKLKHAQQRAVSSRAILAPIIGLKLVDIAELLFGARARALSDEEVSRAAFRENRRHHV